MLNEERRKQLDGIILKMSEQNAPQSDVQFVIDDFKKKYESQAITPAQQTAKEPETFAEKAGGFVKDIARDITKPVVQTLAAPAQLTAYGIDKATGGNSPVEDFSFNLPFWGEISPTKTKEEAVGRGIQTVALGLGPVSGGAAFMGGQAMTENKGIGGVALDTAIGGITGKAGEVATKAVGTVLSKTGKAMQSVGAGIDALIKSAEKNYETVLGPTTKANKRITQQITRELAEREITANTRQELFEKAGEQIEKYGEQIQEFYKALPENTKVNTSGVLKAIDEYKKKLFVKGEGKYIVPEVNKALFKKYQDLQIEIMSMAKNGNAPIEGIRALRQALDKSIAKTTSTFGITGEESIITEARKGVSNILRNELSKQFPDVAVINKEFTFWSRVQQVLGDTIERKTGQGTPLGEKVMTAAGAAGGFNSGGVGHAIGYALTMKWLSEAVRSTAWQTTSASLKMKIAKALSEGNNEMFESAVKDIMKASGVILEKTGNFLKATPEVLKNAPRKDIPGTSKINLKQKAKTILDEMKGKGGLSIQDVSKGENAYRYHETSASALKSIEKDGLVPSKGMYGKGVYFSPSIGKGEASGRGLLLRSKVEDLKKNGYSEFSDEGWTESKIKSSNLEYSKDGGKTWNTFKSDEKVAILQDGKTKIVNKSEVPKGVDMYSLETGNKVSTVISKEKPVGKMREAMMKDAIKAGDWERFREVNGTWNDLLRLTETSKKTHPKGFATLKTMAAGLGIAGVSGVSTLASSKKNNLNGKVFENAPLKKNEEEKPKETILAPANDSLGSFKHDETVKKLADWTEGEASHYNPLDENQTRKDTDGTGAYGRKVEKGSIAFGNRYFQDALKKGAEIYVQIQGMEDVVTPYGKGVFRVDDTMNQRYSQKGKFNIDFHPDDLDEAKKKKGRFPIKFKIVEIKG